MWIKNIAKSIIYKLLKDKMDYIYFVYNIIKYPDMRETPKKYGELNPDKTFYVIRPRTDCTEGLMSLFMNVLKQLSYAERHNYIPVIDFERYETQYRDSQMKEKNVWNYYFTQPSDWTLEEVYNSQNVILAGINNNLQGYDFLDKNFMTQDYLSAHNFFIKYFNFSREVLQTVQYEEITIMPQRAIGLYLRGTDYIKLKPAGESVQPTPGQAFEVVDQMLKKYELEQVFLVTEDAEFFEQAIMKYGDKLKTVSFDSYIAGYSGADFLSKDTSINELSNSPYRRGLYYLVKLIILSHCQCIVGGNTYGSWAACVFADEKVEKKIFELGLY